MKVMKLLAAFSLTLCSYINLQGAENQQRQNIEASRNHIVAFFDGAIDLARNTKVIKSSIPATATQTVHYFAILMSAIAKAPKLKGDKLCMDITAIEQVITDHCKQQLEQSKDKDTPPEALANNKKRQLHEKAILFSTAVKRIHTRTNLICCCMPLNGKSRKKAPFQYFNGLMASLKQIPRAKNLDHATVALFADLSPLERLVLKRHGIKTRQRDSKE